MVDQGRVIRTILRFGTMPPAGSNAGIVSCGIPGPATIGGCDVADATAQLVGSGTRNTWEGSALVLDLGKFANCEGMPLSAICIAPDSAVHSADVWLATNGDTTRHRLSPGNPLIDSKLSDHNAICLVTAVRSMGRDQTAMTGGTALTRAYLANHKVWDSGDRELPIDGVTGRDAPADLAFSWPLRLELYYGGAQPNRRHMRAPYCGSLAWGVAGADSGVIGASLNSQEAVFWICVDGRPRFDVVAWRTDNHAADTDIQIRVYGGDSAPLMVSGNQTDIPDQYSVTEDWIAWDELDAGTLLLQPTSPGPGSTTGDDGGGNARPIRYSYRNNNNPYTFVKVVIELAGTGFVLPLGADMLIGDMVLVWEGAGAPGTITIANDSGVGIRITEVGSNTTITFPEAAQFSYQLEAAINAQSTLWDVQSADSNPDNSWINSTGGPFEAEASGAATYGYGNLLINSWDGP